MCNDDTGRAVEEEKRVVEAARNFAHGRIERVRGEGEGEEGRSATAYSSISKKYKPVDMQMPKAEAPVVFGCMDDVVAGLQLLPALLWTRVARNSRAEGRVGSYPRNLSPQIARYFLFLVYSSNIIYIHQI